MNTCVIKNRTRYNRQLILGVIFLAVLSLGWVYPLIGLSVPVCILAGVGIGFFRGRKWCDWYCPRGSFYDVFFSRVSRQRPIPRMCKTTSFRLGVIAVMFLIAGGMTYWRWPNPAAIGQFFVAMLTVTTILGMLFGWFYHQRIWCQVCPVGSFSNWVGKYRQPLIIDSTKCIDCKICEQVCPMQLAPHSHKKNGLVKIQDGDCLKCETCVKNCPVGALSFGQKG